MFYGCNNLTNINLSSFESYHLIFFNNIFSNVFKLMKIKIYQSFSQIIKLYFKEQILIIFI